MAYRKNPEMFIINECPWFSIFKVTSDRVFSTRELEKSNGIKAKIKSLLRKLEYKKTVNEYLKQQKKILMHRNTVND